MLRFNKREITIVFHSAGQERPDLAAMIDAIQKALKAQK